MNNYITLDGCRYMTAAQTWLPIFDRPTSVRKLWDNTRDVTFGPGGITAWQGDIIVPVTPKDSNWGSISNFRTTYAKTTTVVFTDHGGTSYNVAMAGTIQERSLTRVWDGATNEFYIPVVLVKVSAV